MSSKWIDRKTKRPRSGQQVLVWPRIEDQATAFYGRRITGTPEFYYAGAVLRYVTNWMPLPGRPTP